MTENAATSSDGTVGAGGDGNKYKKGLETREKILAEACELFDNPGYANSSIRRLIRNIGKSSSVIYSHFADKEEILFGDRRQLFNLVNFIKSAREKKLDDKKIIKFVGFVEINSKISCKITKFYKY